MRAIPTVLLVAFWALAAGPVAADAAFGAALNALRAQAGSGPLRADPRLSAAAEAHARDMTARGYFAHRTPEGTGAAARAQAAGCATAFVGENLAWGQPDAMAALAGWAASAAHRQNLLRPGFGAFGLGRSGTHWVLVLADRC